MGLRAFGAVGNLGLSMFWSLGQTGLRTVGTKEPFEVLGHMAYMGFSTFGALCTFAMPYYSIETPNKQRRVTACRSEIYRNELRFTTGANCVST